jgi:hypothetical protein
MPRWLSKTLATIHGLAADGKLRLTAKADRELATIAAGLDPEDVRDVLIGLTSGDFTARRASKSTKEWMYVFKPRVGEEIVYLKLIVRRECVVVSFHEDEGGEDAEDEG